MSKKKHSKKKAAKKKEAKPGVKKEEKKKEKKKREQGVIREYFELIVETAVFVFFVMTFVVQAFQIPTGSMEPTLLIGDFVLVNKFAYARPEFGIEEKILPRKNIRRNDIVVFKYPKEPDKDYVKRLIALEGETIEVKEKQVYINGTPIPEEYKVHVDNRVYTKDEYFSYDDFIRDNFGPVTVPPGQCFVMGDNRDNSSDSRYWGFLPVGHIKGRPWLIYLSYDAEEGAYLKTGARDRFNKFIRFFTTARLKRMFNIVK